MEELLVKKLSTLKSVQPRAEYRTQSLSTILSYPQHTRKGLRMGVFESLTLAAAMALASFLIFLMVGSFSSPNVNDLATPGNIDIQIGEAKYFENATRKEVALRLNELERQIAEGGGIPSFTRSQLLSEVQSLKELVK